MAANAAPSSRNVDHKKDVRCDLGTFVVSIEKFKRLAIPLITPFRVLGAIIRWKYPIISLTVIPVCCLVIILKPDYLIAMGAFSFPLLMLTTLIKKLGDSKSNAVDYNHLFKRRDESPDLILKRATVLKAQEHLDMYLVIITEIQELCNDLSEKLEFFNGIIYWKKTTHTLISLLCIAALAVSLFCFQTRYLLAGLFLSASICNSGFTKAVKDVCYFLYNLPSRMKRNQSEQTSNEFGEETNEEIHADFESQIKEQDMFEEDEDYLGSSSDSEDQVEKQDCKQPIELDEEQHRQRERTGLSFVSKIASSTLASFTRKRRKHGGNCAACNAEFSSILKKRNYCRHCGNSYCSKCCHERVRKVVLGATAPAAYEERVLVCQSCYSFLMNRIKGTNTEIVE